MFFTKVIYGIVHEDKDYVSHAHGTKSFFIHSIEGESDTSIKNDSPIMPKNEL